MIKTAVVLIITCIIVFEINAQKTKSITEFTYGSPDVVSVKGRKAPKKKKKLKTYPEHFNLYFRFKLISDFDKNGNLILQTYSKENGEIYMIVEYVYTDSGNIFLEYYRKISNPESSYSISYKYNSKNELVLVTDSSRMVIKQTSISYPNDSCKESVVKINDKFIEKTISKFNTLESTETIKTYISKDSIISICKKWYDENEEVIKEEVFNSNERLLVEKVFEYDYQYNRIISQSWLHRFNKAANRYQPIDYFLGAKKGILFPFLKMEDYFKNEEISINTDFHLSSSSKPFCFMQLSDYNYDMNDNWTERKDYWNGEIQSLTYRKFEYYD